MVRVIAYISFPWKNDKLSERTCGSARGASMGVSLQKYGIIESYDARSGAI
jgi:hypothetical protein